MARLINGINGPFVGKVGTVVGSSWNGIPYMKGKYNKRTRNISEDEKKNRSKFALAHNWLQPLLPFVREGFRNYSLRSRGFNAAKSHLLKNAIEGEQPDLSINPALVKLAAGDLPLPADIMAERSDSTKIIFTWNPANTEKGHAFDQVMLMAYNTADRKPVYKTTGQFRYAGKDMLEVEAGKTYQLYFAFNAVDRSKQSESVYLGEI